jgi:hypothetical protein
LFFQQIAVDFLLISSLVHKGLTAVDGFSGGFGDVDWALQGNYFLITVRGRRTFVFFGGFLGRAAAAPKKFSLFYNFWLVFKMFFII